MRNKSLPHKFSRSLVQLCKRLSPILDEFAKNLIGRFIFIRWMWIQEEALETSPFNIHGIPTLMFCQLDGPVR